MSIRFTRISLNVKTMVDINKYLETQLALAKQKSACNTKKEKVSEKSKVAAELIAKKQDKNIRKNSKDASNNNHLQRSRKVSSSISAERESDEDADFMPSEDEEGEDIHLPFFPTSSRSKQNVKKIIDDGDSNLYDERVQNWRKDLAAACDGKFQVPCTADIQYILDGNKDPEMNHELQNGLCVPNYIWRQLYKYQRTGVKWLWELHQTESGGLLGDEMGLGKTVQIIAFLAGLSKTDSGTWGGLGPSIIVAPATVIYQWVSHFHYWCPHLRVAVLHHSGSHAGNHNKLIREIHQSHGILLITYAGIVRYAADLMARKWHYMILDEGHKIRNPETQVSKFVKRFQTPHKLLITGSPMQNSLQELWSLFDFMRPGLLGTYNAFMEHFAQPITQGGYANATELQEATALEIAKALKNLITPYMLRRTKGEVQEHIKLPEKNEQVLFCALSQEQRDLYMGYLMSATVRSILDRESRFGDPLRARVLVALTTLRKICNHPDLYLFEAQEDQEQIDEARFGHWKRSGKMTVVNSLLKIWQKQGHRALIFSQSRAMLCLLEQYLMNQGYKYLKMDGTVSVSQRQNLIKTFNENSDYLVFLSTTRVGGLGVNLTGADRVIIYDPDWNPATDNQAKERAWRIGQLKNVTVYRLLSAGTIEEKIYQRQIFKHFLSNKILIDPNQKNVLTTSTLQGLFTLEEPNHDGDTETASLFKHTKVNVKNKGKYKNNKVNLSGSNPTSKNKFEAMKRMAREISKKIAKEAEILKVPKKDPRDTYKKKREALLNPTKNEEPEINIVDDKMTDVPFENVLSEIDIINMHVKKDYEENLLKEVLKNKDQDTEDSEDHEEKKTLMTEEEDHEEHLIEDVLNNEIQLSGEKDQKEDLEEGEIAEGEDNIKPPTSIVNILDRTHENNFEDPPLAPIKTNKSERNNHDKYKLKHKRKHSESDTEIESLVAIKKVKKKKHKHDKEKKTQDDDYVLSKLFAKASVKSALHHDVVVGLAEKEKKHRLKEEASKKARRAVRALKFSS